MGTDLSCGATFGQCFLVIINSIFTLLGLALLVVGCLLKFQESFLTDKVNELFTEIELDQLNVNFASILNSIAVIFIIAGAFVFVVGVFGCFGACCKWRPLLVIYAIIVLLLLILQIAAVAVTLIMRSEVDNALKKGLNETLINKYKGDNGTDTISIAFNNMFFKFDCCGIESYQDLQAANNWVRSYTVSGMTYTLQTPVHCCKGLGGDWPPQLPSNISCATGPTDENSNYMTSCYSAVEKFLQFYGTILVGVGIATWVVEIVCIIFAFCICREIGQKQGKMV